jgi:DNA-binding response OmpR family regulator
MDGPELVHRIREFDRPGYTYVILVTSRSQKEDVVAGIEAGADDFLSKPFDRDELHARLRTGERIVTLERKLEAQCEALRAAQAALQQKASEDGAGDGSAN